MKHDNVKITFQAPPVWRPHLQNKDDFENPEAEAIWPIIWTSAITSLDRWRLLSYATFIFIDANEEYSNVDVWWVVEWQ